MDDRNLSGIVMNELSRAEQRLILSLMCRDNSIADIVEVTGHSPNTVRRHLARFGEAFLASHDRLVRGIAPKRVEVDEIWSYVYAKRERNVCREEGKRPPPADLGAFYTWTALDPDTRLFIGFLVGDRGYETGLAFFLDLNSRIVNRPLITTDGHNPYPDLVTRTFGNEADHVVLMKEFKKWYNPETGESGNKLTCLQKVPQNQTKADLSLASTSLVERLNGSIRNSISRFTRQTYKFSKRLQNHIHAQSIFTLYYNFARKHHGFKGAERNYTPAMKAGLTAKIWSYDDLLDEVDRYWQHKAMQPVLQVVQPRQYVPLAAGQASPLPYFVMYSPNKQEAKVHKGSCGNCRQGVGRKDGRAGSNRWYAFETEWAARRCAEALAPVNHSVCSLCVAGQYVKHGVRSK